MNGLEVCKGVVRELAHLRAAMSPGKRRARARWIREDGVAFVRDLGVSEGDVVLDFGCGPGSYSLPAARRVGEAGRVVAVDRRARALGRLRRGARTEGLRNVLTASHLDEAVTLLKGRPCRAVLLYDVLHFMERSERLKLYEVFHGVLTPDGVLSVHPKHVKGRHAARYFRDVTVEDLVREIESARFRLSERTTTHLWHGHEREDGMLLNFIRDGAPRGPTGGLAERKDRQCQPRKVSQR